MTRAEALKLLDLEEGYSEDDLDTAFKEAAKLHHPDKGGDANMFAQCNEARQRLGPDWIKKRAEEYQHSMDFLIDATIAEATNELIRYHQRRIEERNKTRNLNRQAHVDGSEILMGIQDRVLTDDPLTLSAIMPYIIYKLSKDIEDFSKSIEAGERKLKLLTEMVGDCEAEPQTDITHRYRAGLSKRIGDEQDMIKNLTDVRKATQQVKDMFEKQREESAKNFAPLFLSGLGPRITS